MRRMFLIGLTVLALGGCNKAKQPDATADEEQAEGDHRGGGRFGRMCEGEGAEAKIAKMQKCQSPEAAACNTQIYGSATPTKDVLCGDKDKMRQVFKCTREKMGDDKEKMHAERKRMRDCTSAP